MSSQSFQRMLGKTNAKRERYLYGGLIATAVAFALMLVWLKQKPADDIHDELYLQSHGVYVCAVICEQDQFKEWLGRDYGRLIVFGAGSKGAFGILALPSDKSRAKRVVEAVATAHGLRILL